MKRGKKMNSQVKLDELILLTIKKIGINGEGVGFYKRQTIFVEDALPGEVVEVQITNVQPKFAYGKITKYKKRSDQRVVPKCPYYDRCGGCQLQHLSYDEQLVQKENLIRDSLARYYDGNEKSLEIRPTIGMENPWEYRNFSQLPTRHDGEKVVVGIFEKNSNRLVYIDKCLIESQLLGQTTERVLNELTKANISVYNPRFNQGSLRNLIIRAFPETNEVQVTAVLFENDQKLIKVLKNIPNITSMNYSINRDSKSETILNSEVVNISGKKNIKGKLNNLEFEVFAEAFYPLNSQQLPILYDEIKKAANFKGTENVVSFYSGIGTLELYLSTYAREIRGIDNDKVNFENAEYNLKLSNKQNVKFYFGDVLPHFNKFDKDNFKPDVLIVNPPRGGIELNVINYIQKSKINKIIYVSSNPSTLAKNINHLQKNYKVEYIQPIDIQPQTIHLEAVCVLTRK